MGYYSIKSPLAGIELPGTCPRRFPRGLSPTVAVAPKFATVDEDRETTGISAYDEITDEFLDGESENRTWDMSQYFEEGLDELMDIIKSYNVYPELRLSVDSLSLPTVTVKGLPTGCKSRTMPFSSQTRRS